MIAIMFGGRVGQSQKNHEQLTDPEKLLQFRNICSTNMSSFIKLDSFLSFDGCSFLVAPISIFLVCGLTFFFSFLRFHFEASGWGREEIFVVYFVG